MNTVPPRFDELDFEGFRRLASDPSLSRHEKVGFPDEYREGREAAIFRDVVAKMPSLGRRGGTVLEIGPGCSDLPRMLARRCEDHAQSLVLVDSPEMLALLPDGPGISKLPGRFPEALRTPGAPSPGSVDAIVVYSVVQYVFSEGNLWQFLDAAMALLTEGGEMLMGDIPNIAMRKRFFASAAGEESHRRYTGRDEKPVVGFNRLEPGHMDDSVVLSVLMRARAQGFHAWVLPQAPDLPMANRREDLLIRRP